LLDPPGCITRSTADIPFSRRFREWGKYEYIGCSKRSLFAAIADAAAFNRFRDDNGMITIK
jgi:hypothetical protein